MFPVAINQNSLEWNTLYNMTVDMLDVLNITIDTLVANLQFHNFGKCFVTLHTLLCSFIIDCYYLHELIQRDCVN